MKFLKQIFGSATSGLGNNLKTEPAFSSYFPTVLGMRWEYDVCLFPENGDAFLHSKIIWPLQHGDGKAISEPVTRRMHIAPEQVGTWNREGTKKLIVSVKCKTKDSLFAKYPDSVELTIERDDLGFFRGAKAIFWAVIKTGKTRADWIVNYPSRTPSDPDGFSWKPFFFQTEIGTGIQNEYDVNDGVFFLKKVKTPDNTPEILIFRRQVSLPGTGVTFDEDMFFVPEIGLSTLVQVVDGKRVMQWNLVNFKKQG